MEEAILAKNRKTFLIIGVCLIIAASAVTGWYIFLKDIFYQEPKSNPSTPTTYQEVDQSESPSSTDKSESQSSETPSQPSTSPQPSTPATPTQPAPSPTPTTSTRPTISPLNKEISRGRTDQKQIALTFDAGSGAVQTPQILDILQQNNLRCTFSLTGKWIEQNPDLVKRMINEGHTFINHTYSHPHLTQISDEQIREEFAKTETLLKPLNPNATMKPYFRPPYGDRNQHVWDYAASLGYQSIYWTVDALDWKVDVAADQVKQRIYDNAKPGAIVLMHVGDDLTPQVLPEVINKLQSDGYSLVTLEEVLK